jgi:phospholipase D1/2
MATFLHGTLKVWIKEAVNLPDTSTIKCFGAKKTKKSGVDGYVTVKLNGSKLARTAVVSNNASPVWDERFIFNVAHMTDYITFLVKDQWEFGEAITNEIVGEAKINAETLATTPGEAGATGPIEGWFDIESETNETASEGSKLYVSVEYVPADVNTGSDAVPHAYFDMSSDNDITLYQDAHAEPNPVYEQIVLANGKPYEPQPAWQDISAAIEAAKEFIYITDWSFAHNMRLIRTSEGGETVGEQLMRKADKENVRGLILLWKCRFDTEAVDVYFVHDVITESYFSGSRVLVARVERDKCDNRSNVNNETIKTFVTHHQKTVITDAPVEGTQHRKVIAFLGGLDITTGRWDTQEHRLFVAERQEFDGDFYQSSADVATAADGPRMPWHDIYCRIDGNY